MNAQYQIESAEVEITFSCEQDRARQQGTLEQFVASTLMRIADQEFARLNVSPDVEVSIPEIAIDMGEADYDAYQRVLSSRFSEKLRYQLRKHLQGVDLDRSQKGTNSQKNNSVPEVKENEKNVLSRHDFQRTSTKNDSEPNATSSDLVNIHLVNMVSGVLSKAHLTKAEIVELTSTLERQTNSLSYNEIALLRRWLADRNGSYGSLETLVGLSRRSVRNLIKKVTPELAIFLDEAEGGNANTVEGFANNSNSIASVLLSQLNPAVALEKIKGTDRRAQYDHTTALDALSNASSANIPGGVAWSYTVLERIFSPFHSGYGSLSPVERFDAQYRARNGIHAEALAQYRRILSNMSLGSLVEKALSAATISELKQLVSSLLAQSNYKEHFLKVIRDCEDKIERTDLYWSTLLITLLRGEKVDFVKIKDLCLRLNRELPDVTQSRFSWFLRDHANPDNSSQRLTQGTHAVSEQDELESVLNKLFNASNGYSDSYVELAPILNKIIAAHPDGEAGITRLIPLEYQIWVAQFLDGKKDWRMIDGKELAFDSESRLAAARNTAASWQGSLPRIAKNSDAAIADEHISLKAGQRSATNRGGDSVSTNGNINAKANPEISMRKASLSGNALSSYITQSSESRLANLAEKILKDDFEKKLNYLCVAVELCNLLVPKTIDEYGQSVNAFVFYPGKVSKWLYLLEPLLKRSSPALRSNQSPNKHRHSVPHGSLDLNVGVLIQSLVSQLTLECQDWFFGSPVVKASIHSSVSTAEVTLSGKQAENQKSLPFYIDAVGKLEWKKDVIEDLIIGFERSSELGVDRDSGLGGDIGFSRNIDSSRDIASSGDIGSSRNIDSSGDIDSNRDKETDKDLEVLSAIRKLVLETALQPQTDQRKKSRDIGVGSKVDIEVSNAGLVMTAAYLPRLFAMIGLTKDQHFISNAAVLKAVNLLNYIAFGNAYAEQESILCNILCGVSEDEVVMVESVQSADKEAADSMLGGILSNWNIGNTTVEGFRSTFIARAGGLTKREDQWYLTVAPNAFDVLLDRFPWEFSLIKLPWMEAPIHVEWR